MKLTDIVTGLFSKLIGAKIARHNEQRQKIRNSGPKPMLKCANPNCRLPLFEGSVEHVAYDEKAKKVYHCNNGLCDCEFFAAQYKTNIFMPEPTEEGMGYYAFFTPTVYITLEKAFELYSQGKIDGAWSDEDLKNPLNKNF